jgi:endonuclease/exonuclease/phosphatase family metal-dependent hydrolase
MDFMKKHAAGSDREKWQETFRQACTLAESDVLILNEADIGMCRSGYVNTPDEFARKLGMHYVWAPEFLEVDPNKLGVTKNPATTPEKNCDTPDPSRSQNLTGNAILSRYPMKNPQVVPLSICYDWFEGERGRGPVDLTRGKAVGVAFDDKQAGLTEVRRGGRNALMVTMETPLGPVLVVNAHLENKTTAACRADQFREVISAIHRREGRTGQVLPVILAGDLNTTGMDGTPATLKQMLLNQVKPEALTKRAIAEVVTKNTPVGMFWSLGNMGKDIGNQVRVSRDPSKRNIPFLLPNAEHELFEAAEMFFDTTGTREESVGKSVGKWSNTNERSNGGFQPTFRPGRTYGPIGEARLDWFFVRELDKIDARYGETLERVTSGALRRPSDHSPITIFVPVSCAKGTGVRPGQK